jgi:peptidyl-prolyl cis-trans isomerase C
MTLLKQRNIALIFSILMVFIFTIPCSKAMASASDLLAEIDGKPFTRTDFDFEYQNFMMVASPQIIEQMAGEEGKKEFLEQIIELEILVTRGKNLGLKKSEEYKTLYEETLIDQLAGEILHRDITSVKIEEEEARKYHQDNALLFAQPDSYHLYQILTDSEAKANKIKQQLDKKSSFISIAKKESIDDSKSNGGDKGFVKLDELTYEMAEALRALAVNEVSKPVALDDGKFAIIKYTELKKGGIKDFDLVVSQIKQELGRKKQEEAFENSIERMRKQLKVNMDLEKAEVLRRGTPLTEEEKKAVILTCEGSKHTLAELEEELQQIPVFIRPQLLKDEGLERFLKQFYSRIFAIEYARKNLEALKKEFPRAEKSVERKVLVKMVYDSKMEEVRVTDDEAREFYQDNKSMFEQGLTIKAHHILIEDEAEAKAIKEALDKEPATFESVAKAKSKCPSGERGGDLGEFAEGQMVAEFDLACKEAKIGAIEGPVKTQFGYHIIRVDERNEPQVVDFDKVKDMIKEQLLPSKQGLVFNSFIDELRKDYKVKLYPEKL